MWRFGGLMALDITDPETRAISCALGEGGTPLLDYAHHPVASAAGLALVGEGRGPGVSRLRRQSHPEFQGPRHGDGRGPGAPARADELAVPTQGNAGDSLTHYAQAAGLSVVVAMPGDTPAPILGNVAAAAYRHPDRVALELIGPTIREAGALLKEKYLPQGLLLRGHLPGARLAHRRQEVAGPGTGRARTRRDELVACPTQ